MARSLTKRQHLQEANPETTKSSSQGPTNKANQSTSRHRSPSSDQRPLQPQHHCRQPHRCWAPRKSPTPETAQRPAHFSLRPQHRSSLGPFYSISADVANTDKRSSDGYESCFCRTIRKAQYLKTFLMPRTLRGNNKVFCALSPCYRSFS
jgi:hypothetical protein